METGTEMASSNSLALAEDLYSFLEYGTLEDEMALVTDEVYQLCFAAGHITWREMSGGRMYEECARPTPTVAML